MNTILGILSGENYFDTRALANIVSVCLHRCQQSLQVHPSKGTEVRATSLDFAIHLQRLASEVVNTCSWRWAISGTPMKLHKEPEHQGGPGGDQAISSSTQAEGPIYTRRKHVTLSAYQTIAHSGLVHHPHKELSNVCQGSSSISNQSSESHIIFHCPSYQLISFRDRNVNNLRPPVTLDVFSNQLTSYRDGNVNIRTPASM
jgi:hypothetical protein